MIAEDSVYKIGYLTRVHGLKGEVSLSFTDDVWDRADADYLVLRVDGILVPFFLEEYRFRSDSVALVKFVDVDSADDAQPYVGCEVYFPFELTPEEEPEELRWSHFTGFEVLLKVGDAPIGTIAQVDESTANVLFYIETSRGESIVPAVEEFISDVDHQERRIILDLPEGLLDLNE